MVMVVFPFQSNPATRALLLLLLLLYGAELAAFGAKRFRLLRSPVLPEMWLTGAYSVWQPACLLALGVLVR
uniref:Uncharacterized protein n=1 Tax=Anopheles darlingi TaxID=43151 RepID=A0A2M4DMY3_ANODA